MELNDETNEFLDARSVIDTKESNELQGLTEERPSAKSRDSPLHLTMIMQEQPEPTEEGKLQYEGKQHDGEPTKHKNYVPIPLESQEEAFRRAHASDRQEKETNDPSISQIEKADDQYSIQTCTSRKRSNT